MKLLSISVACTIVARLLYTKDDVYDTDDACIYSTRFCVSPQTMMPSLCSLYIMYTSLNMEKYSLSHIGLPAHNPPRWRKRINICSDLGRFMVTRCKGHRRRLVANPNKTSVQSVEDSMIDNIIRWPKFNILNMSTLLG